jgi:RNA polymerase sigma-70 factor (ECF subfamily)
MSLDVRMTATVAPATLPRPRQPPRRRRLQAVDRVGNRCRKTLNSPSKSARLSNTATLKSRGSASKARRGSPAPALRIAFQYLRDAAEPTSGQDAFVKVFSHIGSYREAWPFEVWFTRILINGCLDRRKARVRRDRWIVPADETGGYASAAHDRAAFASGTLGMGAIDPEARLLARERRARMTAAIDRLEGRQRTVFMLCHYGDCTPREVGAMIGLNESTVRVHLFRAARKLRALLGGQP